ncbi:hypothetical protein M378DRAFT_182338 [Amanita muscaria Koide BX008]|uniref:DUF6532 domain-containing protein n=1 Tax=Amanita muscaria (strain Koide BX008) TaxID=946122 RepID=A0A0C2RXK7_AMAMK|nr:hypothetical protein M378DRAFT_182338 [Amanita muscaria Koide BX008]
MPPPMMTLSLPDRITTRPNNKNKHPGLPDLPDKPRRTSAEVAKAREKAAEQQRQEEEERTENAGAAASIEDELMLEDQQREAKRAAETEARKKTAKNVPLQTPKLVVPPVNQQIERTERPARNKSKRPLVIPSSDESDEEPESQTKNRKRSRNDDDYGEEGCEESEEDKTSNDEDVATSKSKKKAPFGREDIMNLRKTNPASGTPDISAKRSHKHVDDASRTGNLRKKKKGSTPSGLHPGWDKNKKNRSSANDDSADKENNTDEEDHIVKRYGGLVEDDEIDDVERAAATKKGGTKRINDDQVECTSWLSDTLVKIAPNPAVPKTQVEARNGDKKWAKRHLPKVAQDEFETVIVPLVRLKAGTLEPWDLLKVEDVQAIVDDVFGSEKYSVAPDGPWMNLVNARLQTWRHGFVTAAEFSVNALIQAYSKTLNSQEDIARAVKYYLSKTNDQQTMVYQWRDVHPKTGKKKVMSIGFLSAQTITRTLGIAHIAKFPEAIVDFEKERPVGALILATQAVEHVFLQWTTGEFVKGTKQFSLENYGNTTKFETKIDPVTRRKTVHKSTVHRFTHFIETIEAKFNDNSWKAILDEANTYAPKRSKQKEAKTTEKASQFKNVMVIEEAPRVKFVAESDAESDAGSDT